MQRTTLHPARVYQSGMLLFVSIMIMVILFLVSSAFISLVTNDYYVSNLAPTTTESFWFADAGIECMLEKIRTDGIDCTYIPADQTGTGDGWGPVFQSPRLLDRSARERGYFTVRVRLHPDDWLGRGLVKGTRDSVATYPAPYLSDTPYPTPNKLRPYLVEFISPSDKVSLHQEGFEPRLNRVVIESTGFVQDETNPGKPVVKTRKSIYAIYSMTTEELEAWYEKHH